MMEALTGQPCLSSCKSSRYSTASSLNRVNVRAPLPSLPWELDPLKLQSCDNPNKTNQTKTQTKTNTSSLLKKKNLTNNKAKKNILHKTIPYLFKQTLYATKLYYYFKHLFSGARSALTRERNCCFSFSGSSVEHKHRKPVKQPMRVSLLCFGFGAFFKVPLKKKHLNKTITFMALTTTL